MGCLGLILYIMVGAAVGSFLNVVIDRLPEHASLLEPPSHCPNCGRQLTPWEMIPVLSYLFLRGRCRTCGARIPIRIWVVEVVTALLFGLLWMLEGWGLGLVLNSIYVCVLLVILVIDLEHKLILNRVILPALVLGVVLSVVRALFGAVPSFFTAYFWPRWLAGSSVGVVAFLSQIAGAAVAFLIFWLIWLVARQGIGAGDVKLAAFCGLLTAFPGVLLAVLGSFVLGGIVGILLLITKRASRKTAVPFAPFLVLATFVVMLMGDVLIPWYFQS